MTYLPIRDFTQITTNAAWDSATTDTGSWTCPYAGRWVLVFTSASTVSPSLSATVNGGNIINTGTLTDAPFTKVSIRTLATGDVVAWSAFDSAGAVSTLQATFVPTIANRR